MSHRWLIGLVVSVGLLSGAPAGAWTTTFSRQAASQVRVGASGDVVAVIGADVVKLGGSDGAILWRAEGVNVGYGSLPASGGPSLAIDAAGDVLTVGTVLDDMQVGHIEVTKLNGATGARIWTVQPVEGAGTAVAVDGGGDVAVTGSSSLGFEVVKLAGGDGGVQWQYALAGGGAWGVAFDSAGAAFVTGCASNGSNGIDIVAVKLDGPSGSEDWHAFHDGGAQGPDCAVAIAVDRAGDASVAGSSHPGGTEADFTVVKFAGVDGSERWAYATYGDDPGFPEGEALSVAIDPSSGDVVAAGSTSRLLNTVDFTVIKLAGDTGIPRWNRVVRGTAPGDMAPEWAYKVAVDSDGNVVAAGFIVNAGVAPSLRDEDFALVRLDGASGDETWRMEINGSQSAEDRAFVLDVDKDDNVVAGGEVSNFYGAALVVKLSERIAGRKLLFSDDDPSRRKLIVSAAGRGVLAVEAETSVGDPTVSGATLELLNPTTGEQAAMDLPAASWTRLGRGKGYRYNDATGVCTKVILSPGKLKAGCRGPGLGFTLDEKSQGSLGVILTTGPTGRYCMLFGSPQRDAPGTFLSTSAPQPRRCPVAP